MTFSFYNGGGPLQAMVMVVHPDHEEQKATLSIEEHRECVRLNHLEAVGLSQADSYYLKFIAILSKDSGTLPVKEVYISSVHVESEFLSVTSFPVSSIVPREVNLLCPSPSFTLEGKLDPASKYAVRIGSGSLSDCDDNECQIEWPKSSTRETVSVFQNGTQVYSQVVNSISPNVHLAMPHDQLYYPVSRLLVAVPNFTIVSADTVEGFMRNLVSFHVRGNLKESTPDVFRPTLPPSLVAINNDTLLFETFLPYDISLSSTAALYVNFGGTCDQHVASLSIESTPQPWTAFTEVMRLPVKSNLIAKRETAEFCDASHPFAPFDFVEAGVKASNAAQSSRVSLSSTIASEFVLDSILLSIYYTGGPLLLNLTLGHLEEVLLIPKGKECFQKRSLVWQLPFNTLVSGGSFVNDSFRVDVMSLGVDGSSSLLLTPSAQFLFHFHPSHFQAYIALSQFLVECGTNSMLIQGLSFSTPPTNLKIMSVYRHTPGGISSSTELQNCIGVSGGTRCWVPDAGGGRYEAVVITVVNDTADTILCERSIPLLVGLSFDETLHVNSMQVLHESAKTLVKDPLPEYVFSYDVQVSGKSEVTRWTSLEFPPHLVRVTAEKVEVMFGFPRLPFDATCNVSYTVSNSCMKPLGLTAYAPFGPIAPSPSPALPPPPSPSHSPFPSPTPSRLPTPTPSPTPSSTQPSPTPSPSPSTNPTPSPSPSPTPSSRGPSPTPTPKSPLKPEDPFQSVAHFLTQNLLISIIVGLGVVVIIAVMCICVVFNRCCRPTGVRSDVVYHSLREHPGSDNVSISPEELHLIEEIGRGAFGIVYRGKWRGVEVAIKQVLKLTHMVEAEKLFRESSTMMALRHPHIISYLGTSTDKNTIYIVTAFAHLGSLRRLLLSEDYVLENSHQFDFVLQIARGMDYLHSRGLIHRDLKSDNVLVDQHWTLKVADFGLSKFIKDETDHTMTAVGTPFWAAPEILRGEKYSLKADVYSFGVVIWEVVTRQKPFRDLRGNKFELIYQIAMKSKRPTLPDERTPLVELIEQCWSSEPERRPTFSQVCDTLDLIDVQPPSSFPRQATSSLDGSTQKSKPSGATTEPEPRTERTDGDRASGRGGSADY